MPEQQNLHNEGNVSRWDLTCKCCLILIVDNDQYQSCNYNPAVYKNRMMTKMRHFVNNGGTIMPDADCPICYGTGELKPDQSGDQLCH